MRDEYRQIFDELYERFPYPWRMADRPYGVVQSAIQNATITLDLGDQLRSDAKYFLLTNFIHMVYYPTDHPKSPIRGRPAIDAAIERDITLILSVAKSDLGRSDVKEISGHMILNVTQRLWEKLESMKFDIWG